MSTLQAVIRIYITQVPTTTFPNRDKSFIINLIHSHESNESWKNLTDTAEVTIPYNIKVKDNLGNLTTFGGNIFSPLPGQTPLLLRGDKISISEGVFSRQPNGKYDTVFSTLQWWDGKEGSNLTEPTQSVWSGFITRIRNKKPIVIECQDNMYLLKQVKCPNKVFLASQYSVQTMMQYLLNSSPLTSSLIAIEGFGASAITTSVGNYRTLNVTIAQVLEDLRKNHKLECYFRGNQLRCGGIVYYPPDMVKHKFYFQFNILDSNLDYKRLDDIQLGITAYSVNKVQLETTNSRGSFVTKNKRLQVFVGKQGGEIRTLYFWNVPDEATLTAMATQRLNRFYYEGWRGTFETFLQPRLKHGDAVILTDRILPERNGTYLVKSVVPSTKNGGRQTVELDMRIDQFLENELANGL